MIDFKKAFDLVDYSLLLKKLKHSKLSTLLHTVMVCILFK